MFNALHFYNLELVQKLLEPLGPMHAAVILVLLGHPWLEWHCDCKLAFTLGTLSFTPTASALLVGSD